MILFFAEKIIEKNRFCVRKTANFTDSSTETLDWNRIFWISAKFCIWCENLSQFWDPRFFTVFGKNRENREKYDKNDPFWRKFVKYRLFSIGFFSYFRIFFSLFFILSYAELTIFYKYPSPNHLVALESGETGGFPDTKLFFSDYFFREK